jgi:hypothetical protein
LISERNFMFNRWEEYSLLALCLVAMHATAQLHSLPPGRNLVGNDSGTDVDPISVFGNVTLPTSISTSVLEVWSWDNSGSRWNFYSPSMTPSDLAAYARSKGYGVLSTIKKGEGFWINTSANIILTLGTSTSTSEYGGTVFNGIEMNDVSFAADTIGCNGSLTYRNVSANALSPFLYFDIVVDGVIVGDQIFRHLGLAPGAVVRESQYVYSRGYLPCNTFTLRFNAAASATH